MRNGAAVRTAAFYGAIFFAFGVHLPYWPVWLEDWGLTPEEIGFWLGIALVFRVAAAAILPLVADRLGARRALLCGCLLVAAGLAAIHPLIETGPLLVAATVALAVALAPGMPLGEALGIRAAGERGFAYAPVRAAGSAAFLVANLALGALIGSAGAGAIVVALAVALVAAAALAAVHPGGGAPAGAVAVPDTARLAEALRLAARPAFLAFTLAAAVGQASHAVYYVYASLDWTRQGIAPATIGALWATGVAVEIALMLGPGRAIVARIGAARAIALGAGAGLARWSAMALGPPEWALWPLQGLHAMTFALAHLGAMAFIAAAVPPRLAASAQGLFAGGIGGLAMAGVTFAAGGIAGEEGPLAPAYWLAFAMSGTAVLGALALSRLWQGGRIVPEE